MNGYSDNVELENFLAPSPEVSREIQTQTISPGITVYDGDQRHFWQTSEQLTNYLLEVPEADNINAFRVFHYRPSSHASLKLQLYKHFNFERFGLSPVGLDLFPTATNIIKEMTCTCARCTGGSPCGYKGLELAIQFLYHEGVAHDLQNRLEIVGSAEEFLIRAGGW